MRRELVETVHVDIPSNVTDQRVPPIVRRKRVAVAVTGQQHQVRLGAAGQPREPEVARRGVQAQAGGLAGDQPGVARDGAYGVPVRADQRVAVTDLREPHPASLTTATSSVAP